MYPISAVSGQGVRELLFHVRELLAKCPKEAVVYEQEFDPALGFFKDEPYTITRAEDGAFVVEGPKIEKMLGYTNMDSEKDFILPEIPSGTGHLKGTGRTGHTGWRYCPYVL